MRLKDNKLDFDLPADIAAAVAKHPIFIKNGFAYIVTSGEKCTGTLLAIGETRAWARRKAFTKNKKERKGYWHYCVAGIKVPKGIYQDILKEIHSNG